MNFTLLQAAAKSGGWNQLIFYVAITVIIMYAIENGKTKPLIPTIIFLGFAFLLFPIFLIDPFNIGFRYYDHYKKYLLIQLVFFVIGGYYLYKSIVKNRNENKKNATSENTTDNMQLDVYTQIKNLNELKEKGILNEDEFQEKKKKLLAKI